MSSGPLAIAVRKPSSISRSMQSCGTALDPKNASRSSYSLSESGSSSLLDSAMMMPRKGVRHDLARRVRMQLVVHGVHGGHRDAENTHDGDHAEAGERFEHRVAGERAQRSDIARHDARREPPAIHGGEPEHQRDQRELRQ